MLGLHLLPRLEVQHRQLLKKRVSNGYFEGDLTLLCSWAPITMNAVPIYLKLQRQKIQSSLPSLSQIILLNILLFCSGKVSPICSFSHPLAIALAQATFNSRQRLQSVLSSLFLPLNILYTYHRDLSRTPT